MREIKVGDYVNWAVSDSDKSPWSEDDIKIINIETSGPDHPKLKIKRYYYGTISFFYESEVRLSSRYDRDARLES